MPSTLRTYHDPHEYCPTYEPKTIADQVASLRALFPHLATAEEKRAEHAVPAGAEAWFAIPRWQSIAPTYGDAVEAVLAKLSEMRGAGFANYRKGCLDARHLKQTVKSADAFEKLGHEQTMHAILIVAAQLGTRYRGRSVRRVHQVMGPREFGLGAYAVGILLLIHPERMMHRYDLHIDCPGDEYSVLANDERCSFAPIFAFGDNDRLRFDATLSDAGGSVWGGSASAFLL